MDLHVPTLDLADPAVWPQLAALIEAATPHDVDRALASERLSLFDLAALLSPMAEPYVDAMAARARALTLQRFGRTIVLYVPRFEGAKHGRVPAATNAPDSAGSLAG